MKYSANLKLAIARKFLSIFYLRVDEFYIINVSARKSGEMVRDALRAGNYCQQSFRGLDCDFRAKLLLASVERILSQKNMPTGRYINNNY